MTNKYLLELETKLAEQEETIANFKKEQSASIKIYNQQKTALENLNQSNQKLITNQEKLNQSNSQLKEQTKTYKKQLKDLEKENKSLGSELAKVSQAEAIQTQVAEVAEKDLSTYKQKVKDLTITNTQLIEKYNSLEEDFKKHDKTLAKAKEELTSQTEKNQILENKLEQAKNSNLSVYSLVSEERTLSQDFQQKISELETEQEEILKQAETARNEQAAEIDKLEQENTQLDTDLNKAVDLLEAKDKTISQLEQTIAELKNIAKTTVKVKEPKTFLCSNCQQTKTQEQLSRVFGKHSFCLECSKEARKVAQKQINPEPSPEEFICHLCQISQSETPTKMKLDETLQDYLVCSQCKPLAKEFNEADLITEELWNKYPYSSASEILEKEFGIKRN